MHFKDHQEYLKFIRSAPVEPKEYEEETAAVVEEVEDDGEVLQAD